MRGLAGKTAIVVGGAGDIGSAIVRRLWDEKMNVVIADFDGERGAALARELGGAEDKVTFEQLDAGSSDSWKRVVAATLSKFGTLDAMVNTAFQASPGTVEELSDEAWSDNFRVTLDGTFYGIRECIAVMRAGSAIVNFSSIAALTALPPTTAYGAAKSAVVALTRTVAFSCAARGIRLNSLSPGFTSSRQLDRWVGTGDDQIPSENLLARIPLAKFATSEQMAGATTFLLSDDAGYITGINLVVDGGYTLI